MTDEFAVAALLLFIAGIAVIEHQPILAFVLAMLAIGVLK
jgi:hypothetical protein